MTENNFNFLTSSNRCSKKKLPVYCIKFCPFVQKNVFAAGVSNRVEIHKIVNDKLILQKIYEIKSDEYLYALDWSLVDEVEAILIAGGKNGKLYNVMRSSVFGAFISKNAINDIKFNPVIPYLFAAACGNNLCLNNSIHLYNALTETCIAIYSSQRVAEYSEFITVTFDLSGNYMAFGTMTKEVFVANLKDNQQLQVALKESYKSDANFCTQNFNLLHNVCTVRGLHKNYVDMIHWYDKFSFVTKSCDGTIIFWCIKGVEKQKVPFSSSAGLTIVKQHELRIDDCTLWFIRFALDPFMKYLAIGNGFGQIILWTLKGKFFENWKYEVMKPTKAFGQARYLSFSNCGQYLAFCTESGHIVVHKKSEALDENANLVNEFK